MMVSIFSEVQTNMLKHLKSRGRFCPWHIQLSRRSVFTPFSSHMKRLLKGIRTKNGQKWDNEVKSAEQSKILGWKQERPIVAETSIDREHFNTATDKSELHVFANASEDTICAVAYLRSQPKRTLSGLSNCQYADRN